MRHRRLRPAHGTVFSGARTAPKGDGQLAPSGGGRWLCGAQVCHALARQPVRVTLIDQRNFNLFQPLPYQVASGLVSEADVASPLRQMVGEAPNIQILLDEVVDIDPEASEVGSTVSTSATTSSSWPPARAAPISAVRSGVRWPHP